jgi:hypothetical protein
MTRSEEKESHPLSSPSPEQGSPSATPHQAGGGRAQRQGRRGASPHVSGACWPWPSCRQGYSVGPLDADITGPQHPQDAPCPTRRGHMGSPHGHTCPSPREPASRSCPSTCCLEIPTSASSGAARSSAGAIPPILMATLCGRPRLSHRGPAPRNVRRLSDRAAVDPGQRHRVVTTPQTLAGMAVAQSQGPFHGGPVERPHFWAC